ncbi:interferon-induced protein with tetratricopeptide repeats 5-like [Xyrauchen texanus]|uniref:interferon-induced protein with tetratricopeptide repeats 5-like n=1 Tax=Xyrauchen texanus TaxID=154827 RepID=UPI002241A07D|nr:interferon-induced protein with tetratricopeptide repeats 5-like [Xyrauchen texanus]
MSVNQDRSLRENLLQLECHFTWALIKDDFNVTDVLSRLEEQIKLDLGKKEGLAQTYSALAYVKFLLEFHEEALCNLMTSVKLSMECHGEEFHKTLIVTYGNLAWMNYHMKNYTECESYLKKLQKINELIPTESSSVPEVLGEKGWTFLKFSRTYYDRAIECFRKALEQEPEEGEWNAGYAIALYRIEYNLPFEDSLTIKQLRRAIDTNPDDDVLKVLLGMRLAVYKRYDEAEIWVEKALERSPEHPHVMRYVGKYFRNKGCVDRSMTLLKRALENAPNSSFIHHQLALCYKLKKIQLLQEGSHHAKMSKVQQIRDLCIYHLEKSTTLKPSFISAMSDLALQYGERRELSRADELFEITFKTAKQKNDNLHVINFYYAEFQLHCHKCEALAIKHYMECLKMFPESIEGKKSAYNLKKIADKRIHRNTDDADAHGILGFIHRVKGENRQAIECYEKALSYGDNAEYLSNLCALRLSLK